MCPINHELIKSNRGRPTEGLEKKSVERKIRIEPYIDCKLSQACKMLGISRSEGIRQGVLLFLKEAEKQLRQT